MRAASTSAPVRWRGENSPIAGGEARSGVTSKGTLLSRRRVKRDGLAPSNHRRHENIADVPALGLSCVSKSSICVTLR